MDDNEPDHPSPQHGLFGAGHQQAVNQLRAGSADHARRDDRAWSGMAAVERGDGNLDRGRNVGKLHSSSPPPRMISSDSGTAERTQSAGSMPADRSAATSFKGS